MFEHYFLLLSVTLNFCYIFLIVPDKNKRIESLKEWGNFLAERVSDLHSGLNKNADGLDKK